MTPGSADPPNRSRWMRAGRECMAAGDWAGAIRAYGQGLMEQPLLGMHYAANLERARTKYRQERQTINQQGPEHTSADLVHLSKPRLPAVVFGLLYKLLWGASGSRALMGTLRLKRRIWNDVSFCREAMEPAKWAWA